MIVSGRLVSGFYNSYDDRYPTLKFVVRTADDKKVFVDSFKSNDLPYFYIKKENKDEVRLRLITGGIEKFLMTDCPQYKFATTSGTPVKVEIFQPWMVSQLRKKLASLEQPIELYEADMPYIRKILINKGINAGITINTETGELKPYNGKLPKPRFLYIDIEVDDSQGFPEEAGQYAILAISTTNDKGERKYFTWDWSRGESEAQMLTSFFDYAQAYDYLIVWNKDFENKHLPERFKALNIFREWRIFQWVDLAEYHRMFYQKTYIEKLPIAYRDTLKKYRKKIDRIGVPIFEEKLKRLPSYYAAWKSDPNLLQEANQSHSYALYVIEKAMGVISLYSDVADEVGIFIDYAHLNSHIVDTLAMRFINVSNQKFIVSSAGNYNDKKKGFRGAVVFPAKRGVHRFLYLFDFTSLYNRIIQSYYLDPIAYYHWGGTFAEHGVEEYIKFAKSFGEVYGYKVGDQNLPIFPAVLNALEKKRNELKEERKKYPHGSAEFEEFEGKQKATKVILLAAYGDLGMSSSRWAVFKTIPEALILQSIKDEDGDYRVPLEAKEIFVGMVTHLARKALSETKDFFDADEDVEVIYGDTDSNFVRPLALVDNEKTYRNITEDDMNALVKFGKDYSAKLEEFYKGRFETGIEMKLEKIMDRGVFGKVKKQYYTRVIWDEDNGWQRDKDGKLTWYEYTKGLPLVRTDRTEFMRENQRKTLQLMLDDPKKLYGHWKKVIVDFYAGKNNHQLIQRVGIKKPLDQYDKDTPVLRAAKMIQDSGQKIRPGEKVAFVIYDIQKGKKISAPIDENMEPEDAIKLVPPVTKAALDFYWSNVWKNTRPFLELVLDENEILMISYVKTGWTLIGKFF